jgi:glycosyltransferase involved in cell wall biosynthesis
VSERPLRVAWLGHRATQGGDGIITYSREITNGLRARGVEVIFFHHSQSPEFQDEQSVALDALKFSHRFVLSPPRTRRQFIDQLRRHEVDLVHVSFSFSTLDFNLPEVCRRMGVPLVATFHVPFDTRLGLWPRLSRTLYRIYSQVLSGCDAVVIFSDVQKQLLESLGVPAGVVHVLPNGVDVDKYTPGESDKRAAFGAERLFSYIGRLDPEKNVDRLLGAFLDVEPPRSLRLVLVGGGSERRRLERRYRDPRIIFTGTVTDEAERIAILRASDAFFLPSTIEGLSLAMLEAMACGVATIATDVGSDGDALRGAGIVLDPEHVDDELRVALRLLMEVPCVAAELGRLARERAVTRYSLSQNLDGLLELYRALVNRYPIPGTASM